MNNNEDYFGALRVTNPNTLKRYVQNGELTKLEEEGYEYQPGCGRFKTNGDCKCHKCRVFYKQIENVATLIKRHSRMH